MLQQVSVTNHCHAASWTNTNNFAVKLLFYTRHTHRGCINFMLKAVRLLVLTTHVALPADWNCGASAPRNGTQCPIWRIMRMCTIVYFCPVVAVIYTEHPLKNKVHAIELSFAGYSDFWLFF